MDAGGAPAIPAADPVLFVEVDVGDASAFADTLKVRGLEIGGYRVLRCESAVVPNAMAYLLLYIRDTTGKVPHIYLSWSDTKPLLNLVRYLFFGEGDTAPVMHEVLRRAEPDPERRPLIHVGGER